MNSKLAQVMELFPIGSLVYMGDGTDDDSVGIVVGHRMNTVDDNIAYTRVLWIAGIYGGDTYDHWSYELELLSS